MYNEVIKLRRTTISQNVYGDLIETPVDRTVFVKLLSIGAKEFYQAAASGLKPEVKFILPDFLDYQGEKRVLYTPFGEETEREYEVIRTYRDGNQLELTCARGVDR